MPATLGGFAKAGDGDFAGTASRAFTIPTSGAGAAAGHIAYAVVVWDASAPATLTAPAGWFQVATIPTPYVREMRLYRRTAVLTAPDLGTTVTFTLSTADTLGGAIFTVAGADTTTPEDVTPDVEASPNAAGSQSHTLSVTTVTAGCLIVALGMAASGGADSWATPTGFFSRWMTHTGGSPTLQQKAFTVTQAGAGPISATMDPGFVTDIAVMMLAVRPAAGGADTTAPTYTWATNTAGTQIIGTADEPLHADLAASPPPAANFVPTVAGVDRTVSAVAVSPTGGPGGVGQITLTLAGAPIPSGVTVVLDYTAPT